ncbi:MAG TPA: ImmA/IrrE family metallo-endopeptidase [Solirubrobacteraceae bacterium]|nr:ImmA/IrrE family metallo-endopeptidase [Solirubrobacteraceae bacterium]
MTATLDMEHTGNAERDAESLLDEVWLSDAFGRPNLPVDPVWIAQRLGIFVFIADLADGVSGMLVKRAGQDPQIYLQRDHHRNRQRFTCAHELGHFVAAGGDDTMEYVERRALLASQGSDPSEIYANQFAAALLMPRDVVNERCDGVQFPNPVLMSYDFGVSADAMKYRLINLGHTPA